ncbi:MAG: hypothetical protein DRI39_09010 [Chloroflexi bacterium]|nr:MAG: hypothetical protein DRI39_09010 [Chloroflexota bacterium]
MDEVVTRWEYVVFVFLACVGVLQLVGVRTRLNGLLFFRTKAVAYVISFLALAGSFWWFFVRDDRWDTVMRCTGLEGAQQFYYFCLAAFLAVVFTLALSSLLHAVRPRLCSMSRVPGQGLDALRDMSYFQAVRRSFKSRRADGPSG